MRAGHRQTAAFAGRVATGWLLVAGLSLTLAPSNASAEPIGAEICEEPTERPAVTETPWAQRWLDYEQAWRFSTGRDVVVAVIDTGVDAEHPQLRGRVLPGIDVVETSPLQSSATTREGDPGGDADDDPGEGETNSGRSEQKILGNFDCHGHGTFVAGIIAATKSSDNPFFGVAPDATILPLRQDRGNGNGTAGGMARAIVDAVDAGANVINISSSVGQYAQVLADAVDYATANDVLVIASVSNNGALATPTTSFPAALPGVVSVGSIDEAGQRSDTSETGTELDLVAPGQQVTSTLANTDGLGVQNGTSYATPFVAGTAALVRSRFPELTASQVAHRLTVTSDYSGRSRPNEEYGWGVLNPVRALTAQLPEESAAGATPQPVDEPAPPPPPDNGGRTIALATVGGMWLALAAAWIVATVVRSGQERGWRPPTSGRDTVAASPKRGT